MNRRRGVKRYFDIDTGFPCGSADKEPTCNVEDLGLIPGLERSPGGGNGNSFQYFCLESPMDREI